MQASYLISEMLISTFSLSIVRLTVPLIETIGGLPTRIVNPDIVPLLTEDKSYPRILQSPPTSRLMHSIFQATMGRPEISI